MKDTRKVTQGFPLTMLLELNISLILNIICSKCYNKVAVEIKAGTWHLLQLNIAYDMNANKIETVTSPFLNKMHTRLKKNVLNIL